MKGRDPNLSCVISYELRLQRPTAVDVAQAFPSSGRCMRAEITGSSRGVLTDDVVN